MQNRRQFWILICSVWGSTALAGDPLYTIVPIVPPAIEGAGFSMGTDLNDFGDVLGAYSMFDQAGNRLGSRAFVYTDAAGLVEVPVPPWGGWLATAGINDSGQLAAYGDPNGTHQFRAYRYAPGTGFEPLGTFGGTQTEAAGINNAGQVTGFSEDMDGHSHVFRYTDGVGLEAVGMEFTHSSGYAINEQGWIAGSGDGNAVLFRDQGTINLGPGIAYGVNDAGDVVGQTYIVPGHPTAFVYLDGEMLILGDDVFPQPILYDINNQNVAVGIYYGLGTRPLLWSEALLGSEPAGLVDLNTLLPENSDWTLISASGINDSGQITGWGFLDGEPLAYRLDPVPEPSTWALFGLGGFVFLGVRRFARI